MFKKLKKKYWEQGFDDGYKIGYQIGVSGVCEEPVDYVFVTGLTTENNDEDIDFNTTSASTDDFEEEDLNNLIGEGFEI